MTDRTWPPSPGQLTWRPADAAPASTLALFFLQDEDGSAPDWVAVPEDVARDVDGDVFIPVHRLAEVLTDVDRPGGGGISSIYAVPTVDDDLRIVIVNDDQIPFVSPIERMVQLPTLGELLQILDETEIDGEVYGVGHPLREANDTSHREALRGFVRIRSRLYPDLEPLDQARLDQWIAERP